MEKKFNPEKLLKLNSPQRLETFPPKEILKRAGLTSPRTLIDFGAGTALFSKGFAEILPESQIYACDISDVMINWIEENICPEYPQITPVKSSENEIPLKDQWADMLFMVNLHHELHEAEKALKEAHRLLKTQGIIAVSDWKKEDTGSGPPQSIRVDSSEIELQLKKAGFTIMGAWNDLPKNTLVLGRKE